MAGNQLGKTIAGGFEAAMHATGKYPEWWIGKRFDKPTVGWASGVTGESTRDNPQRILLGRMGQLGTGAIPAADILDKSAARGIAEAIDTVKVRHVSGGASLIGFKSYERGREKWQGETLDWIWYDEEPPADIYAEGLTRTNATKGLVWITFTPLLGRSIVVKRFTDEVSPDRHVTTMTIDDAGHYTAEDRKRIIAGYLPHEREARAKGVPMRGSGLIFPVSEESIGIEPFDIPKRWKRIGGMDFGWEHPFAAVELAYDHDADVIYVTKVYRQKEATPLVHASALRKWGTWLPWAWPHDGLQHDKGSGEQLAEQYRQEGLNLTDERATFEDGTNGVEAGISEMLQRMQTKRWRVFSTLSEWFEEFRHYHRDEGKIIKLDDDLLCASRYGMMMLRHAAIDGSKWGAPLDYSKMSKGVV